jgi:integration host factor subunit beta
MKPKRNGLERGGASMNKSDLIKVLSEENSLPFRKAEEIVNLMFDSMSKSLVSGDRIEIRGFGSFGVKDYEEYTGRNPKTGEETVVGPKRLPFFKVGLDLRERVDQK